MYCTFSLLNVEKADSVAERDTRDRKALDHRMTIKGEIENSLIVILKVDMGRN